MKLTQRQIDIVISLARENVIDDPDMKDITEEQVKAIDAVELFLSHSTPTTELRKTLEI